MPFGPAEMIGQLCLCFGAACAGAVNLGALAASAYGRLVVATLAALVASTALLTVAGWLWLDMFNLMSLLMPPTNSWVLATAAVLALLRCHPRSLVIRAPGWARLWLCVLPTMVVLAAGLAVVCLVVPWVTDVKREYPYARVFLDKERGGVHWEGGHVLVLDLRTCDIAARDLDSVIYLPKLSTLDLSKTPITDEGVRRIASCSQLRALDLGETAVTDEALRWIEGLTSLEHLSLQDTPVTDAGVRRLRLLTQMRSLYLGRTGVTDACLPYLYGMTRLG
jgi:hypothetical protein